MSNFIITLFDNIVNDFIAKYEIKTFTELTLLAIE